ncbi:unnamed protein product [Oppiella nova]|uniref:Caspase family p20 domain-containing protein n=1 Tax=Oppiella nova TaxID=334625 RepID=A0A7R9LNL5_9ACAR|nr:unnamed protein product [Oppiella nova]CAG2164756.1 unnamed protein product [Oppiella nova]
MNTGNIQPVYGGQYQPNSSANNGYNFGANSTGQPNLTHTSSAQTGWPYTEPLTPSYGTSTSVHLIESTSSPLITNSINTDNNIEYPVFQDLVDLELPTNEGTVGQGLEYMYTNEALPQQQPQPSANTSTAVESYETPLVLQTNATNNILRNQTNNSADNIVYDMIHTLINKINLGLITTTNGDELLDKIKKILKYENKGQQMIKEIADELMQKGPDELKQLLARAGLQQESEAVVEMFITREPWKCTTDVELKVIKEPELRSGNSRYFQMNSHPRGRAIIFAATDGLDIEIKRWKSIFAQLDFKCEVYADSTCSEIKDKLLGVSCQRFVADALFVMVIGGGFDQKIYGYGNREVDNEMSFTDIVNIFSANNDKSDASLRMKPKIFVFNTFSIGENYVAKGSGVYTCEAHRQWFARNAKLQEYNTQDVPQNSAKCAKRSRSNTTQGTGFVPNQGTNYNVVPGHHPGPHSTNTVATQQTNQSNTYPAQAYTQQFNPYNQEINANTMQTSTSPQLHITSMTVVANSGNQSLNGLQTNNTITTPTNSSLDNRIEDMIFTFVNKIDLGQMSTTGDPLLDEMKKIQQNEHENKCRIQHIRRVLNDPGRLKQFLDNTGSHQLANELVEMFKMDYPWPYRPYTDLPVLSVVRASELRSGNTRYFFMDSSPRGRAIVFICADGLDREADRWESILGQLGFEQDVYRKAKCSQIRDVLLGVSTQPFDADALFVMFIGGRYDEKIHGYGGNEMWITDIVDIFSDTNCVSLRNKPKIFVFNTFSIDMNSWFNPTESITLFGQAFSYTIAQLQKCLDTGMTPPNQQNGSQKSTTLAPNDDLENSQAQTHPQPPIANSGDTTPNQANIVYMLQLVPTIQVLNQDAGPFTSYPSHPNTISQTPNQHFIQQPLQPIDPNSMILLQAVVAETPIEGPDVVPSQLSTTSEELPDEEINVSESPIISPGLLTFIQESDNDIKNGDNDTLQDNDMDMLTKSDQMDVDTNWEMDANVRENGVINESLIFGTKTQLKRKLQDMPQNTGTHTKRMAIEYQSYDRSNRKDGSVNHGAQLKTTITKNRMLIEMFGQGIDNVHPNQDFPQQPMQPLDHNCMAIGPYNRSLALIPVLTFGSTLSPLVPENINSETNRVFPDIQHIQSIETGLQEERQGIENITANQQVPGQSSQPSTSPYGPDIELKVINARTLRSAMLNSRYFKMDSRPRDIGIVQEIGGYLKTFVT